MPDGKNEDAIEVAYAESPDFGDSGLVSDAMTDESKRIDVVITQPIAKGSIILIREEQVEPSEVAYVMNTLKRVAGHDRFMLMFVVKGASLDVHGPADLVDALRQLAREALDKENTDASSPEEITDAEGEHRGSGVNDLGASHGVPVLRPQDRPEGGARGEER